MLVLSNHVPGKILNCKRDIVLGHQKLSKTIPDALVGTPILNTLDRCAGGEYVVCLGGRTKRYFGPSSYEWKNKPAGVHVYSDGR